MFAEKYLFSFHLYNSVSVQLLLIVAFSVLPLHFIHFIFRFQQSGHFFDLLLMCTYFFYCSIDVIYVANNLDFFRKQFITKSIKFLIVFIGIGENKIHIVWVNHFHPNKNAENYA